MCHSSLMCITAATCAGFAMRTCLAPFFTSIHAHSTLLQHMSYDSIKPKWDTKHSLQLHFNPYIQFSISLQRNSAKLHTKATNHSRNLHRAKTRFLKAPSTSIQRSSLSHTSPTHKCLCHSLHYLIPSSVQWKLTTLLQKKSINFPLSI